MARQGHTGEKKKGPGILLAAAGKVSGRRRTSEVKNIRKGSTPALRETAQVVAKLLGPG
jgi:hypothetical protein